MGVDQVGSYRLNTFQKRVVYTKLDICVRFFITITESIPLVVDYQYLEVPDGIIHQVAPHKYMTS